MLVRDKIKGKKMVAQLFQKHHELLLAMGLIFTGIIYMLFGHDIQDLASFQDWWPVIKSWTNMIIEELRNVI